MTEPRSTHLNLSVAVHPWRWIRRRFWAGWYAYRVPSGWGVHFGFGYLDVTRR
jgi:hypothetical protein